MKLQFMSVRNKILFWDFAVIFPMILLFAVMMLFVLDDSKRSVNESRLEVLKEQSTNILRSNDEMIRIINGLSVNSEVNRIISQKTKAEGYEYLENNRRIQEKLREITELFYNRQYEMMILCDNHTNYFQQSLEFTREELTLEMLMEEEWYQEMQTEDSVSVFFLPRYRSEHLSGLFPEDTVFAVQRIKNLNSGRKIGLVVLAANQLTWKYESRYETMKEGNIVIDQHGTAIFPMDEFPEMTSQQHTVFLEQMSDSDEGYWKTRWNQREGTVYYLKINGMDWKLIDFQDNQTGWSVYAALSAILCAGSLLGIGMVSIINCNFISHRMKRINANIIEVSEGNLQARIRENYEVEFQEMCGNFNNMLDQIEDLMEQLEMKEQEKYILEFQSLQSQINSHFLHNTLATVRFMIQIGEYQDADRTLIAFSKLLRKAFSDSRRINSLAEELEMVTEYMELMSLRFQGKFCWEIISEVDTDRIAVLKNTLQPLVENCISHGFNMKEEMGHIYIRVRKEESYIIIEVEDDGIGADLEKITACIHRNEIQKAREQFSEIGLSNIQMRIRKNFGEVYGLTAYINHSGGVTFSMKIPEIDFVEEGIQS